MKKKLVVLISVLMVLCSSVAFAEDDVRVSLGIKAWQNSWQRMQWYNGDQIRDDDYGSSLMVGPSLSIKGSHLFGSIAYLKSTKDYTYTVDESNPNYSDTFDANRTDTDLTFGVMFNPHIGIFIGYKSIKADQTGSYTYKPTGQTTDVGKVGTYTFDGPAFGVTGNVPLGDVAALYANLAYVSLKYKHTYTAAGGGGDPFERDVAGPALELGVAVGMGSHFSGNVGYKIQDFTGEKDNLKVEDKFMGLTLGLNLTF